MDASFSSTRECKFLRNLLDACEAQDVEAFTGHVVEWDRFSKLDEWKTRILLKVKKSLGEDMSIT